MAQNSLSAPRSGGSLEQDLRHPLASLHHEVSRLFDDVFHGRHGSQQYVPMMPSIDVSETDKEVLVRVDLPGTDESDIDVSLDDDLLTIRGERKFEQTDEKENYHLVECSYGTFQRSLRLPFKVDPQKVDANFDNGVLTVTLPKGTEQEESRKIQVKRGRGKKGAKASK